MRGCKELQGVLAVAWQPVDAVRPASPWQGRLLTQLRPAPIRFCAVKNREPLGLKRLQARGRLQGAVVQALVVHSVRFSTASDTTTAAQIERMIVSIPGCYCRCSWRPSPCGAPRTHRCGLEETVAVIAKCALVVSPSVDLYLPQKHSSLPCAGQRPPAGGAALQDDSPRAGKRAESEQHALCCASCGGLGGGSVRGHIHLPSPPDAPLPLPPSLLLQVQLDGESRAKYERWQAAGERRAGPLALVSAAGRRAWLSPCAARLPQGAPAKGPANWHLHCSQLTRLSPAAAAGRAVIEQHLRDGTLLQQYTAVLEILLRLRQVGWGRVDASLERCGSSLHSLRRSSACMQLDSCLPAHPPTLLSHTITSAPVHTYRSAATPTWHQETTLPSWPSRTPPHS